MRDALCLGKRAVAEQEPSASSAVFHRAPCGQKPPCVQREMVRVWWEIEHCGSKRVPCSRRGQRTLINASVTSSGRLETEILLSPVSGSAAAAGPFGGLAPLVFFAIPPAGATAAAVAAFVLVAAFRGGRRPDRPPRRAPAGRSFMMASSDWSSFPDMASCGLWCDGMECAVWSVVVGKRCRNEDWW